jgi:peptidoglycan hydrolase-like protein with peptidoglycan-binding domain
MLRRTISCLLLANVVLIAAVVPAASAPKKATAGPPLSMANVNDATWRQGTQSMPFLIKLQVLLDRAHASPGQIDAKPGENTRKAVAAFREMQSLPPGEKIDETLWRTLTKDDMEAVLVSYTISAKDVAGPFIEKVPSDYREKANLKRLAYTSAEELLAEKFHMSEALLRQLNPGAAFDQAGTEIVVASVQREDLPRKSRASRSMPQSNVFVRTTKTSGSSPSTRRQSEAESGPRQKASSRSPRSRRTQLTTTTPRSIFAVSTCRRSSSCRPAPTIPSVLSGLRCQPRVTASMARPNLRP